MAGINNIYFRYVILMGGGSEMEEGVTKVSVVFAAAVITVAVLGLYVLVEEADRPNVGYTLNYEVNVSHSPGFPGGTVKMEIIDEGSKQVCWKYTIDIDDGAGGISAAFSQWSDKDSAGKPSYGDPNGTDTAPDGIVYDVYSITIAGMNTVSYVDKNDGIPYWVKITINGNIIVLEYVP